MYQTYLPLHAQFALARLKLHLKDHPEQAQQIAIDQFTYYLEALEENRKLLNAYARLRQENQNLMELVDTPSNDNSPLPSFLKRFFN